MNYTTIKQSKKLVELGLNPDTADMFYIEELDEYCLKDIVDTKYPIVLRENQNHHLKEYGVPCWSLGALLEAMPNYIRNCNQLNKTTRVYGLNLFRSAYHCCGYSYGPSLNEENQDSLCCFGCDTWIEAAYKTVCWLLENGYIKKGE